LFERHLLLLVTDLFISAHTSALLFRISDGT